MPETSVEIWSMILMGKSKALDLALCRGSDQGFASEFNVSFRFLKNI